MKYPEEFTREAVAAASENVSAPYRDFVQSGEPNRSLIAENPWMTPPRAGEQLVWGEGRYYDTTIARKHPYWKDKELPKPTKRIDRLRHDFHEWGFCLIEDAISADQTSALRLIPSILVPPSWLVRQETTGVSNAVIKVRT